MKKQAIIYTLFAVLIAVVLWMLLPGDSVERIEKSILLGMHDDPERISIADAYDTVYLERNEGAWHLDKGEKASEVAVENLLWAARNLRVDGLQPLDEKPRSRAVTVVFSAGEKEILRYELFPLSGAMLIRHEKSSELCRVSLPGYGNLDLGKVFSTSINHYREHMLIDLQPSEICSVELERKGREAYCFTMDSSGNLACLLPGSGEELDIGKLDEISIRLLFSYFTAIRYEDRLEEGALPGVEEERWLATLRVEAFSGEEHELRIFSMEDEGEGKSHLFLALVIHNGEVRPLVVKYLYLDVLMRDLSRFFKGSA